MTFDAHATITEFLTATLVCGIGYVWCRQQKNRSA